MPRRWAPRPAAPQPPQTRALVLIDARLGRLLERELAEYVRAASCRRGFPVVPLAIPGLDDAPAADLRRLLAAAKRAHPELEGVLLVGNVKLPSFFMPRPDVPSVRLWPRYFEDLDMAARRASMGIATGPLAPQEPPAAGKG